MAPPARGCGASNESRRLQRPGLRSPRAPRRGRGAAPLFIVGGARGRLDHLAAGDRVGVASSLPREGVRRAGGRLSVQAGTENPITGGAWRNRRVPDIAARAAGGNARALPHDRDYLATLVHLSVASIATAARPTSQRSTRSCRPIRISTQRTSACIAKGPCPISSARSRSRSAARERTTKHLEDALELNERAGFARGRPLGLRAGALAALSPGSQAGKRARALFARVLDTTRRLGMDPLARDAQRQLEAF